MSKKLFGNSTEAVSTEDINSEATSLTAEVEPVVETPTETPPVVEEPVVTETPPQVDPKVEAPVVETPVEPVVNDPGDPKPTFDISVLNKNLSTNFESLESLKTELEKSAKVGEYETKLQGLDTLKAQEQELKEKYELLLEQSNPMSYFSNQESFKLEQFKKQFPGKDPAIAQSIFMSEDLNGVDDFEIVKWGYKLDHPKLKGGEQGIKETVAEEFGIDPELELSEWSNSAQNRLSIKADEYRSKFETMKQIETPNLLDIDAIRQQRTQEAEVSLAARKTAWSEASKDLTSSLSELKIPIGIPKEGEQQEYFNWDTGGLPQERVDRVIEQMVETGMEVNSDTIEFAKNAVRVAVQDENLPKIMAKFKSSLLAEKEVEHLKQTHNPEPLSDSTRTEDGEKGRKEFNDWVRSASSGGFQPRPLIR